MSRTISGFDYMLQRPVEHTLAEWRAQLAATIASKGFRRAEAGETFLHGPNARIRCEIYGIVTLPGRSGLPVPGEQERLPTTDGWLDE